MSGIVAEEFAVFGHVARFEVVIELLFEARFQFAIDDVDVDLLAHHVARNRAERLEQDFQILEILIDGALDAGILHLHRDVAAVLQLSAMHLAERGRRERGLIEGAKKLLRPTAQLFANLIRDHRIAHRGHVRLGRLEHVKRFAGQQVVTHREHLDQLQKRAAKLRGSLDDALRVLDVGFEELAIARRGIEEGASNRRPQIAISDLRGELAHLHRASRAPGGEVAFRHQPSCFNPTRLIRVAANAAPKPLSMFTTVTPLEQVFSIPRSAAMPPNAAP